LAPISMFILRQIEKNTLLSFDFVSVGDGNGKALCVCSECNKKSAAAGLMTQAAVTFFFSAQRLQRDFANVAKIDYYIHFSTLAYFFRTKK
jgi:hypothetical protein